MVGPNSALDYRHFIDRVQDRLRHHLALADDGSPVRGLPRLGSAHLTAAAPDLLRSTRGGNPFHENKHLDIIGRGLDGPGIHLARCSSADHRACIISQSVFYVGYIPFHETQMS